MLPAIYIPNANWHYLLAVSGGRDSMAMLYAFFERKLPLSVAHMNFKLRGQESDDDEAFVKAWCQQHQVPFYSKWGDTKSWCQQNRGSLQEAARHLRYQWFQELADEIGAASIATAHHQEDQIETVLFHIGRGCGMKGLCGIPRENGRIIRPILHWTSEEIEEFVMLKNIVYRSDSSNQKTEYTRNQIRHDLLPCIEKIFPGFKNNMLQNIRRWSEADMVYQTSIQQILAKLITQKGPDMYVPIRKIIASGPLHTLLYEWLHPYHFTPHQCEEVSKLLQSQSGASVYSSSHRVVRDRNNLILTAKNTLQSGLIQITSAMPTILFAHGFLQWRQQNHADVPINPDPLVAQVDATRLKWPLVFRPWKPGDYMYPLGMKKKKKVARILMDAKVPLPEKDRIWVLLSGDQIVWIAGYKLDDRFRVKESTSEIVEFTLSQIP